MAQPKPAKQTHLEYLLTTIEKEPDDAVAPLAAIFRDTREQIARGELTEQQVRDKLNPLKDEAVAKARCKYRTEQLLIATIDYVIDPERKIRGYSSTG